MTHCQSTTWGSHSSALTMAVRTPPIRPPTAPSHVLFGLIAGAILCRPRLLPTYIAAESPIHTTVQRNSTYHSPAGSKRSKMRWLRFQPIKSTPKTLYTKAGKMCDTGVTVNITLIVNATILRNRPLVASANRPRWAVMASAKAASTVTRYRERVGRVVSS